MPTIHEEIENWLAADVHDELSLNERRELETHLAGCRACRSVQQEEHAMNNLLNTTLSDEAADPGFEQRIVSHFRRRLPAPRRGFVSMFSDLLRMRSAQIAGAAALLLTLVQVGRMVTHEDATIARLRGRVQTRPVGEAHSKSSFAPAKSVPISPNVATDQFIEGEPPAAVAGSVDSPRSAPAARDSNDAVAKLQPELTAAAASPESPEFLAEVKAVGGRADMKQATAETPSQSLPQTPIDGRKLIRNAQVDLEVLSFDDSVQKITALAAEARGYIATSNSQKQANGKLRGQVVAKVLPENLDRFLQKLRALGELKNQTLGTDDVTKAYFDTDMRLKNARVMEQRLVEMLKRKSDDINDLLQVEKELGRVREQIERMQGELKFMDAQVQFATVTITVAEKDMNAPAAFLLKEHAQLALYSPEVEKIYNDIKALASPKVQITNAQLDRDNTGRVSARVSMLIEPEESEGVIARVKGMGRVENFQMQTERVAQGGTGMSENAKTERDKVELNTSISRDEQEQALQQTTLQIRTRAVDENARQLRAIAEKTAGRIRSSSFSRDPHGREIASVSLRVPMKNYGALMQALAGLGKLENVSVTRQDRTGERLDEANAPADVAIEVYGQGNIVSEETGVITTLRRILAQGAAGLMWSVLMIGVALAFLAPWVIAVAVTALLMRGIKWVRARARQGRTP